MSGYEGYVIAVQLTHYLEPTTAATTGRTGSPIGSVQMAFSSLDALRDVPRSPLKLKLKIPERRNRHEIKEMSHGHVVHLQTHQLDQAADALSGAHS